MNHPGDRDALSEEWTSFPGLVRHHASRTPRATALQFGGRRQDFGTLHSNMEKVAAALDGAGVGSGDRVAYLGKNSDRYFELLLGTALIGAVIVPVGWRLAPPEIEAIVEDADARLLFVEAAFAGLAEALAWAARNPRSIVSIAGEEPDCAYVRWRDAASALPRPLPDANRAMIQLYTSGTTGKPKGVMLTHRNILHWQVMARERGSWFSWIADEVSLLTMPVSHISGTGWWSMSLIAGAPAIVHPEFRPDEALEAIGREAVSRLFVVPAALQLMARHPSAAKTDFSRLRYILYGGSPIPVELLTECVDLFGCGFVQLYGLTETAGAVVHLPDTDHVPSSPRLTAAGKANPETEIRVVDDAGDAVDAGTTGEIQIRSPNVMPGYWRRDDASAEAMTGDGWFRTGDAGYLDADGYLFVRDRIKDMIVSGGENVYAAEVENVIHAHPAVGEAAVIGIPDAKWGEAVVAIVAPKSGVRLDEDELLAFLRERLAGFKLPKAIKQMPLLPRNASGKILKRDLRAPYWEGRSRGVS